MGQELGQQSCPTCSRRWIEKVSQKDREIWRLGSHTKTDFISITFWLTVGLEPGKTTWWWLSVSSWKLSVSYHLACPLIWWCSLNCNSISGKRSFNLCPASGLMRNTLAQESRDWALKGKMTWVYISALPFTLLALWHWQMYKWHYLACGFSLCLIRILTTHFAGALWEINENIYTKHSPESSTKQVLGIKL